MLTKSLLASASVFAGILAGVEALISPTDPAPNSICTVGQPCVIKWNDDGKEGWSNFKIDFMTGDNQNQVFIENVATNLSSTGASGSYSWTTPEVNPHSAIYFFMFSNSSDANAALQWTTRFAIVDAGGQPEAPPNATQPNGPVAEKTIPWGVGALATGTTTSAGPSVTGAAVSTSTSSGSQTSSSYSASTGPHKSSNAASVAQPAAAYGALAVAALVGLTL